MATIDLTRFSSEYLEAARTGLEGCFCLGDFEGSACLPTAKSFFRKALKLHGDSSMEQDHGRGRPYHNESPTASF